MTVLNPDHLFEQADRLITPPRHGPPRQVDLRRAISGAYDALFHFVATSVANEVVGASHQATNRYRLVYRSIDHRALSVLCGEAVKQQPAPRYLAYFPAGGFSSDIKTFAIATRELQQKRHIADYDPAPRFKSADAEFAVFAGRDAVTVFQRAPEMDRKIFLTLLLCPPR